MDDFRMEVDEHGNIKVMSYVEAVAISKEEQEQALRIFKQLQEENDKLREMAEKYIRQAYSLACEKGNPITKGIIIEDARELGIEVEDA